MTPAPFHVGDVAVCAADRDNPYGGSLIGPERREALRRYRDGEPNEGLAFWFAPSHGGARRLKGNHEVDWDTSGVS